MTKNDDEFTKALRARGIEPGNGEGVEQYVKSRKHLSSVQRREPTRNKLVAKCYLRLTVVNIYRTENGVYLGDGFIRYSLTEAIAAVKSRYDVMRVEHVS